MTNNTVNNDMVPNVGDKVSFTTEKDGLIVIGKGKVQSVHTVIENETDNKRSHRMFVIEAENGEFYPVHSFYKNKKRDTIILLEERAFPNEIYYSVHGVKHHHTQIDAFYEQEAERNLPKIGEQVVFTLNDHGNLIQGNGVVVHRIIRNPKKMEALFRIKNDNGEEIEVYHNSQRAINENVMLISN